MNCARFVVTYRLSYQGEVLSKTVSALSPGSAYGLVRDSYPDWEILDVQPLDSFTLGSVVR